MLVMGMETATAAALVAVDGTLSAKKIGGYPCDKREGKRDHNRRRGEALFQYPMTPGVSVHVLSHDRSSRAGC